MYRFENDFFCDVMIEADHGHSQFGNTFAVAQLYLPDSNMRTLTTFILWCILLVICWPLAVLLIFIFPLLWLLLLPFRIIGFTLSALFEIIGSILMFPFRLLRRV